MTNSCENVQNDSQGDEKLKVMLPDAEEEAEPLPPAEPSCWPFQLAVVSALAPAPADVLPATDVVPSATGTPESLSEALQCTLTRKYPGVEAL